ncbi:kinase-like protein [Lepidopterella palustris CBS 459.81]|uniref:Kinase-like protein n=1 Tax=Lepidopterella palustris CBS 459.81 TaxID=1314670 RepID=A0A8E2E7E9_9PEZI|nr:kinase-like protein [Lepidopterella palustris CBS 459.81]
MDSLPLPRLGGLVDETGLEMPLDSSSTSSDSGLSDTVLSEPEIFIKIAVVVEPRRTADRLRTIERKLQLPDTERYSAAREMAAEIRKTLAATGRSKESVILYGSQGEKEYGIAFENQFDEALKIYCSGDYTGITFQTRIPQIAHRKITERERILDRLMDAQQEDDKERFFIPVNVLREIFTEDDIRKLFEEDSTLIDKARDGSFISRVCQGGFRLLATCILSNLRSYGELFLDFCDGGVWDEKMPLDPKKVPSFCTKIEYTLLCQFQWRTLAVELQPLKADKGITSHQHYATEWIVPFVEKKEIGHGGFGKVFRVRMAPNHQTIYKLPNDPNPYLALKQCNRRAEEDFKKEYSMLVQIAELNGSHIIKLLAAFQHGEEYFLLFPFAKCNLKDYFEENDPWKDANQPHRNFVIWIFGQLHGLAKGLKEIHEQSPENTLTASPRLPLRTGYHHDLKPENLLVFDELEHPLEDLEAVFGRILMSDFGLGKLRTEIDGSATNSIQGSPVYAAPEANSRNSAPKQARSYDIWSFGCIMLESLVWLRSGSSGQKEFAEQRSGPFDDATPQVTTDGYYYYNNAGKAFLRNSVTAQIEALKQDLVHPGENGPVVMLLNLISDCLKINDLDRPKAPELAKRLGKIHESAQKIPMTEGFFQDSRRRVKFPPESDLRKSQTRNATHLGSRLRPEARIGQ